MYRKTASHVINKKEQSLIAAVSTELINNCDIDYYPDTNTVKVFYNGPTRFAIKQQVINSTKITKEV